MITEFMVLGGLRNGAASRRWVVPLVLLGVAVCCALSGGLMLPGARAWAAEAGPVIEGTSVTNINERGATLEAQINPQGIATTYEFWVESAVCTGGSATCQRSGHPHKEEEGYIAADSGSKTVSDDVTDLLSEDYFWYWVVAANSAGIAESAHDLFQVTGESPGACPDGCSSGAPVETKPSQESIEQDRIWAEGAPAREAARQQAAKEQAEREAALLKADQPASAVTTSAPPSPAVGSVSLAGTAIPVQRDGAALVKLECVGSSSCSGKLVLAAKIASKGKGKKKAARMTTTTIGTAGFSIPSDETKTVNVELDAAGRALLGVDHGHLGASLAILESAPNPANTQTNNVRLMRAKAFRMRKS